MYIYVYILYYIILYYLILYYRILNYRILNYLILYYLILYYLILYYIILYCIYYIYIRIFIRCKDGPPIAHHPRPLISPKALIGFAMEVLLAVGLCH